MGINLLVKSCSNINKKSCFMLAAIFNVRLANVLPSNQWYLSLKCLH